MEEVLEELVEEVRRRQVAQAFCSTRPLSGLPDRLIFRQVGQELQDDVEEVVLVQVEVAAEARAPQ